MISQSQHSVQKLVILPRLFGKPLQRLDAELPQMAQMFMLHADTLQLETRRMPSQITFSLSMKASLFLQLMMAHRKPNQHYNPDQENQRLNSNMTQMRMKSALVKAKVLKSQSTPQLQLRNAHLDMVPPASSRPSSSPKNACLATKS